MDRPPVIIDTSEPVGRMELNRPHKLNALSVEMMEAIVSAAAQLARSGARVVVVSGRGDAFCAGFDVGELTEGALATDDDTARRYAGELGTRMAAALEALPQVTVAALHGHVVGGGLVLAAACDLRVAAEGTTFSIPEVDLGIPLAWGGIPRLVAELGPALTRELVMTCRAFDASEALARGFLNRVTEDLAGAVAELAAAVSARPVFPIRSTKRQVAAALGHAPFDEVGALLTALDDSECRDVRQRYLAVRGFTAERGTGGSH